MTDREHRLTCERDEARRQLALHRDARRVTARALEQANNDADAAWKEVERLRERLGMECCEGGVLADA